MNHFESCISLLVKEYHAQEEVLTKMFYLSALGNFTPERLETFALHVGLEMGQKIDIPLLAIYLNDMEMFYEAC